MALTIYPDTNYDSFSTVADADAFLTANLVTTQRALWDALGESDKEIYLRQATTLIKNKITLPSTLEDNLKHACIYLANYSVGIDMTNDDGSTSNLKRKRIEGVIDKEWFGPNSSKNSFPDIVDMLLKDYDVVTSGSFAFERA